MDALSFYEQLDKHSRQRMLKNLELLTPEEFTTPLEFLGGRSPRDVALHIIVTELFWMHQVLAEAGEPAWPDAAQYPDVESVRRKFAEIAEVTKNYLRALSREQLLAKKTLIFPDGNMRLPMWQCAYQSITHEFHHKGQLMSAVRHYGHAPLDSDFI